MTDIKTKKVHRGYIKMIDHAACMGENIKSTAIKTRLQNEHEREYEQDSASSWASDSISSATRRVAIYSIQVSENIIRNAGNEVQTISSRIDIKSKIEMLRRSSEVGDGSIRAAEPVKILADTPGSSASQIRIVPKDLVNSSRNGNIRNMSREIENSRVLARKVDSARKAGTLKTGARGVSNVGKMAFKGIEKAIAAFLRAMRAAIEGTKALIVALSAGGLTAIVIIIICILFGAAFYMFGDDSSSNYTPVSEEVDAYTELITKYAEKYGIPEYAELIKAVMMQESGGRGTDPMQCSESPYNKKYSSNSGNRCRRKIYGLNSGVILVYGVPKY